VQALNIKRREHVLNTSTQTHTHIHTPALTCWIWYFHLFNLFYYICTQQQYFHSVYTCLYEIVVAQILNSCQLLLNLCILPWSLTNINDGIFFLNWAAQITSHNETLDIDPDNDRNVLQMIKSIEHRWPLRTVTLTVASYDIWENAE